MAEPDTVIVQAYIDRDFDTETAWVARVMGDAPYHGLFATGAGFKEARQALARVVYEAAQAQATPEEPAPSAVRVYALTRKTFSVDQLATAE